MDAEAGRMPPAHNIFDQGVVYSAFIFEHLKHVRPEKSREVIQINLFGQETENCPLGSLKACESL